MNRLRKLAATAISFAGSGKLPVFAGLLWAAQAAVDPVHPAGSVIGPALVTGGLLVEVRRRRQWKGLAVLLVLTVVFSLSAHVPIDFKADSVWFYSYLRSMVFDGDLDFTNEIQKWGYSLPSVTPTGLRSNTQSVGPAVLWSPFFGATHLYVRLQHFLGSSVFPANGYSIPYLRSTVLGTLTVVVVGAFLCAFMMARKLGPVLAAVAVVGAIFTSTVPYYAFVMPAMSHGVTFGASAGFLWAWDRARRTPTLSSWTVLGVAFGLVVLCRSQGAVYLLLLFPLSVREMISGRVRWIWLLSAAAAAVIVFFPQMLAWKILYGQWITIPQGGRFFDLSSPNLLNTLISANHGFFNWTPIMFLGFIGLFLGLRKDPLLFAGGLLVFVATAWINGSVLGSHWAGGDAFGARRFTLVVPLMAVGLGLLLDKTVRILARAPLIGPADLLLAASLWNIEFISKFREWKYRSMAPLEQLAKDQARSLRLATQDLMGWIAGEQGRALAYKYFSAEYFYTRFNRSGTINLRTADENYLLNGWSTPSRRTAKRPFRRALYPEACVRIPLDEPFPLRVAISARAPADLTPQVMTIAANGKIVTSTHLLTRWRNIPFTIPEEFLIPGENALCLRFSNGLPERNGERLAGFVERIQLP